MNWIFVVLQTLPVAVYGNTPPLQAACNYNGYTMANNNVTCQCEKPWQGATCDILNLKPVSRALGLGYQYQINGQNVTSWGGVFYEFISNFVMNCLCIMVCCSRLCEEMMVSTTCTLLKFMDSVE
eukprot:m.34205 g.34205  ORF g.34205 m.34205 type:complete len:125 (-) comp8688_c0_seq2:2596-2970(-)